MSHLQYTVKSHHLQWNLKQLSKICHQLYRDNCPDGLKHRRNISLSKVSDESLLVLLLLQAELGLSQNGISTVSANSFIAANFFKEVALIDEQDS